MFMTAKAAGIAIAIKIARLSRNQPASISATTQTATMACARRRGDMLNLHDPNFLTLTNPD